jgi:hypothetical protein
MADENESTEQPPVSPYAFMRRPFFIISALFAGWVLIGQGLMPQHPPLNTMSAASKKSPPNTKPSAATPPPGATTPPQNQPDAGMQQRLDEMDAKLKALNTTAAPANAAGDAAMAAQIATLQATVEELKKAHSANTGNTAQIMETLHKQEADITALKAQLASTQAQSLHRLALITAFNALKDAIARGDSFAEPLKQMNDLAKNDAPLQPALAQFAPYASDSAPTVVSLKDQFEAAISPALTPDDSSALTRHLRSMIRIRKVGEQQPGNNDEAVIARAEAKLNHSDVKASADEIAKLSPPAARAFSAWGKKTQAFLSIHNALDALQPQLLQLPDTVASATPLPKSSATQ